MGNFSELTAGRKKLTTVQGITADREFIDKPGTGEISALPQFGDPHPEVPDIFVRSVGEEQYGDQPGVKKFTFGYEAAIFEEETAGTSSGSSGGFDPRVGVDVGGESIPIETVASEGAGTWTFQGGDPANQKLFQRIVTGTMRIERVRNSSDLDDIIDNVGLVNNVGFPNGVNGVGAKIKETFLFVGANVDEARSQFGGRIWRITYNFSFRQIPAVRVLQGVAGDPPLVTGGWNHILNKKSQKFERPVDPNGNFLYQSANLQVLI